MSPSFSIKSLCILCLLFVSASAQFLGDFPFIHPSELDPENDDNDDNHLSNFDNFGFGFPGFELPGEDNLKTHGHGKEKPQQPREQHSGQQGEVAKTGKKHKKPKGNDKEKQKQPREQHNGQQGEDSGKGKKHKKPKSGHDKKHKKPKAVHEKEHQPREQHSGQQGGVAEKGKEHEKPKVGHDKEEHQQHQPPEQHSGQQAGEVAETGYAGKWELVSHNSGVSAMHLQLMPNNKLIMFDATSLGKSNIQLLPGNCRIIPKTTDMDCFAHSVEYDLITNQVRTLKVTTDPWCSSGGLAPDGTLVGTGGWADGEKTIRYMPSCPTCDWRESNIKLADNRWYATQTLLGDGRFIVIGGRRAFNYEFLAPEGMPGTPRIDLPFLRDTTDLYENNLYPFVHIAPNGNVFILANNKAILLDVKNNKIVRTYPDLPGGARNYPGSGSSAILPIDLKSHNHKIDIEVLVCGGAQPTAFGKAEKESIFLPALDTCGRIKVLDQGAKWEIETMPSPRVMGDMLNLPNGDILLLNGAKRGASGWQFADEPNLTPVQYSPNKPYGNRFKNLNPTQIPRMYHATSAILPDGKVLVAGSNTNPAYQFDKVKFPTELRVEKFHPPYLDPQVDNLRLVVSTVTKVVKYGGTISSGFKTGAPGPAVQERDLMVTMYQPPFTTHGYSMNQRLLRLAISNFAPEVAAGNYKLQVVAPATGDLASPGYYLLFVNYKGVPSEGSWIHISA